MRLLLGPMLLGLLTGCGAMTVGVDDDGGSPDVEAGPTAPDADVGDAADAAVADAPDAPMADAAVADAADAGPNDPDGALRHLRALMVGTWVGTAEAPPTASPSRWSLEVTFAADGRYEAACTDGPCAPFFYDDPGPDPRRMWTLDGVLPGGDGAGALTVVSPPGTVQRGELVGVRVEAQLSFELWTTWSGTRVGPIRYALRRRGG